MAANFWRNVLEFKAYMFDINFLWCRTICEPMHQVLRKYSVYRYISALALGPDDQLWTDLGIPYAPSYWQVGSIDFTKHQHVCDMDRVEELGKMFGSYEGRTPVLVICDPEKVKSVLVNFHCFRHRRVYLCRDKMHDNMLPITEGSQWRRMRNLLSNRLGRKSDIVQAQPMLTVAASVVVEAVVQIAAGDGLIEDGRKIFGAYTMDVVGRLIFGQPFADFTNPDNEFAKKAVELLIEGRDDIVLNTVLYPEFRRRLKYCTFDPAAMAFFRDYAIQQLRSRTEHNDDLLQLMIDAERVKNLNMDELYAQCAILIALAYHSVSFTMAVACFEISKNEEIQERLKNEIDSCIIDEGGLNIAATARMSYLDKVLSETLRKCPPAVRIERVCNEDTEILGTPIARGTVVAVPVYALHNHKDYFDNPKVFNPDRFSGSPYDKFTYIPFGENQRMCLASRFAKEEMRTFMAYLLSQVYLLPPTDMKEIPFSSKKNILLADKIPFRVERRGESRVWKPEEGPLEPRRKTPLPVDEPEIELEDFKKK